MWDCERNLGDGINMKNTAGQVKRDYIWNMAAGIINAAEAVIMSMIVTRITGLEDAGILSIAFSIGILLVPIGKFGLRPYQATDIEKQFSFSVYVKTRMVTVSLMIISICGYLVHAFISRGYDFNKICVIFAICMIYVVEAVEDVIWGYYQNCNRLDAGAKLFCFRWFGIMLVFPVALYISRNLAFTLILCFLVALLLFLILLSVSFPHIASPEDRHVRPTIRKSDIKEIKKLLKIAVPLMATSFLSVYVNNAPKYAIDACLTDEIQACYGFVAMPIFVIKLLSGFIFQPMLVPMAVEWEQKQTDKFIARIIKQVMIIAGISAVCLAGAYFLGVPVLSLLYHTDLSGYKRELMILLAGSGLLACAGYMGVVLTIIRCQKELIWPYGLVAVLAAAALKPIVSEYGTIGAAISYLVLIAILCVLYSIIFIIKLKKNK